MEDVKTLRRFIDGSNLPESVKDALFDCILIELRKGTAADLLKVVKTLSAGASLED